MEKLGFKILHAFFGLEPILLKQEKLYNSKSNSIYILFAIAYVIFLYCIFYLTIKEVTYDQKWFLLALFCLIPSFAFYSLISFSFISWRYSKSRENKGERVFTLILRSSIQLIVIIVISVLSTVLLFEDLGEQQIIERKKELIESYNKLNDQKEQERLRPFENALVKIQNNLDISLVESKKGGLRLVEKQYYNNQIKILFNKRDSLSELISTTKEKLKLESEKSLSKINSELEKNNFFFIKLIRALEDNRFYIILSVFILFLLIFNTAFYKRFLSESSDYFNLDILLQERLIEQESVPVINHTKKYLKSNFNYNYKPPLSQKEIQKLIEKKRVIKNKENLIEKLKSVD